MGCCCKAPLVGFTFTDPVPPPLCGLGFSSRMIYRGDVRDNTPVTQTTDHNAVLNTGLQAGYVKMVNTPWALYAPNRTAPFCYWGTCSTSNQNGYAIATHWFEETRLYVNIALTPDGGATNYSLRQLYAASALSLNVHLGHFASTRALLAFADYWEYIAAYTTFDILWGLHDSEIPDYTGGLTDIATNTLQSGVAIPGIGAMTVNDRISNDFVFSLDSLVDESGSDYLLLVLKVPDADLVAQTTVTPPAPLAVGETAYVFVGARYDDRALYIAPAFTGTDILEIWPCVAGASVNIDIDIRNASSIVEEDRTRTAVQQTPGDLTTNRLRVTDVDMAGSGGTTSYLDLDSVAVTNWGATNPASIDKTNRHPATPSAFSSIDCEKSDDNEAVTWNLTAIGGGHTDGSITATVHIYNSVAANTYDFSVELYVNGAWTTPVTAHWNAGTPAWRRVVLATGLSAADFSSHQLRITSPTMNNPDEEFEAIYVRLDSTTDNEIARQCDIFITEAAGDYFLNFDYQRITDPNDSTYYLDNSAAFQVEVGPGTSYLTIGDIEGVAFSFSHAGANNVDTGEGTEDATIAFTLETVVISGV